MFINHLHRYILMLLKLHSFLSSWKKDVNTMLNLTCCPMLMLLFTTRGGVLVCRAGLQDTRRLPQSDQQSRGKKKPRC